MEKINSKFLSRCFGKKASFNKKNNQTKTIYEGGQSIEYDFFFFLEFLFVILQKLTGP